MNIHSTESRGETVFFFSLTPHQWKYPGILVKLKDISRKEKKLEEFVTSGVNL